MATISNNEFRDMSKEASFPFSSCSTLKQGSLRLALNCFLDAFLYPLEKRTAPYRVSELNGVYGSDTQLEMVVTDSETLEVCRVVLDTSSDTAMAIDAAGSVVGVVVSDTEALERLIGRVGRTSVELDKTTAVFAAGVCASTEALGNLFVKSAGETYSGDIVITAAEGVHFTIVPGTDPDSSSSSTFQHSNSSSSLSSGSSDSSSSTSSLSDSSSSSSPSMSESSSHSRLSTSSEGHTSSSSSSSDSSSSVVDSSSSSSSSSSGISSSSSSSSGSSSSSSSPSTESSSSPSTESSSTLSGSSLSSPSSPSSSSDSSDSSDWLNDNAIAVNVYGELYTLKQPIVSINGREMEHVWLASHPDSAVRVVTDPDEKLIIGKSKDFGNAT